MVLRAATAATLAAAVTGCSGIDGGTVPQTASAAAPSARSTSQSARGTAVMTIRIPRPVKHPAYISPSTKSLTVFANGTKLGSFDLTPSSSGCKKNNGGTQCSITLGVPTGTVTFKVETFSETSGGGSMLSEGTVTQDITRGKTAAIALTLSGIVKSAAITLGNANPRAGSASSTRVYVTAYDATGAAIVGPGNFTEPIALTNSDTTHTTDLSTTTVNNASTAVTLSYDGGPLVSATIGANIKDGSTVVDAIFAPVPEIAGSYSVPSSVVGKPYAITTGSDGATWFTTVGGRTNAIVRATTDGAMTAFVGGIGGLTNDEYLGIASGSDGNLWFTEYATSKIGRITPGGGARPVKQFALPRSWCPVGIAADSSSSGLWFTSYCKNAIGHIAVDGTIKIYSLPHGGSEYTGIAVGKDGNLYIADRGNAAIGQVRISGDAVTGFSEVKVGKNSFDGRPNADLLGVAQTGDGTIWWTNNACSPSTIGSLVIGSPFSSSKVEQYITKVGCSDPAYLSVVPAGGQTLWLAEEKNPIVEQVAAPTGGGIPQLTDYTVQVHTPNGSQQGTAGITLGPDGNLWATVHTAPGNIVKLVY
jgi:virginiamycin B lyase